MTTLTGLCTPSAAATIPPLSARATVSLLRQIQIPKRYEEHKIRQISLIITLPHPFLNNWVLEYYPLKPTLGSFTKHKKQYPPILLVSKCIAMYWAIVIVGQFRWRKGCMHRNANGDLGTGGQREIWWWMELFSSNLGTPLEDTPRRMLSIRNPGPSSPGLHDLPALWNVKWINPVSEILYVTFKLWYVYKILKVQMNPVISRGFE